MMRKLFIKIPVYRAVVILLQAEFTAVASTPASRISSAHAIFKTKTSQIHVSSNGDDDEAYKRLTKRTERYNPETDEQLTKLIQAIQNATLLHLSSSDEWRDDPSLIQIKRLNENDLVSEQEQEKERHDDDDLEQDQEEEEGDDGLEAAKDISMIKLKFDSCLDVIKLPIAIPEKKASCTQFLFVRPDEYVLFFYMNQNQDFVLTGNPGISKSWFQWKYILFCFRQDLYNQLKPADFIEKAEEYPSQTTKTEMTIPQRIIRTIEGKESYVFHVNRPNENVTMFEHQPTSLKHFATEDSTILWEPGEEMTSVRFISISARIIATVSPLVDRFKEFEKNGAIMLYMPCPSMTQLRLMGQIYRSNLNKFPSDDVIQERVKKYGPYIRIVLLDSNTSRKRYLDRQKNEIMSDASQISFLIKSDTIFFKGEPHMVAGFSHRLARFEVTPNPSAYMGGYGESQYECSTERVVSLISQEIRKLEAKDWTEALSMYNAGIHKKHKFARTCFEELFSYYCTSANGLKWNCRGLKKEEEWKDYNLQLLTRVNSITKYGEMKDNVLYHPTATTFPFVDMYYKEGPRLIGVQVTTSNSHAKPMSAYLKFREALGINTDDTIVLHLHYLFMPSFVQILSKESLPSFFWKDLKEDVEEINNVNENIQFYAILPPKTFEAS